MFITLCSYKLILKHITLEHLGVATYLVFTETIHRLVIVNLSYAGDDPQQVQQRSRHWAQAVAFASMMQNLTNE